MNKENAQSSVPELYGRFSAARRQIGRVLAPFYIAFAVNVAAGAGAVIGDNKDYRDFYLDKGVPLGMLAQGVGFIASMIRSRLSVRKSQEVAVQIAQGEGRTPSEPFIEANRVMSVLSLFSILAQDHSMPSLRGRTDLSRKAAALDQRMHGAQFDLRFKALDTMYKQLGFDDRIKREILASSLEFAENYWHMIAEDRNQPEHRRRYAYQMILRIRRYSNAQSENDT